mmetsp:Transcript_54125/g.139406  ORF Transcript_54125/g.139406 Transcript_54125/m.139406 type:complete len:239 (-) Transcript_54125:1052-1768(-)
MLRLPGSCIRLLPASSTFSSLLSTSAIRRSSQSSEMMSPREFSSVELRASSVATWPLHSLYFFFRVTLSMAPMLSFLALPGELPGEITCDPGERSSRGSDSGETLPSPAPMASRLASTPSSRCSSSSSISSYSRIVGRMYFRQAGITRMPMKNARSSLVMGPGRNVTSSVMLATATSKAFSHEKPMRMPSACTIFLMAWSMAFSVISSSATLMRPKIIEREVLVISSARTTSFIMPCS